MKAFLDLNLQDNNKPGVAILIASRRPESLVYLKSKIKTCCELGINCMPIEFPEDVTESQLVEAIQTLNNNSHVHGTLVQLPLPVHLRSNQQKILDKIAPEKDVDGLTNENLSRLFLDQNLPHHIACTPSACLHILRECNIDISGKKCVIVNRSRVVGLPLSTLLFNNGASLVNTTFNSPELATLIQQGDIILTAIGKHNSIKAEWIKPGAVVIDIGISVVEEKGERKIVGDISFLEAVERCSLITPVPGGVGPLTVMMLMKNVISGWARTNKLSFMPSEGALAKSF
jgi:methylenetetrahydrofolate dehydrogenase (NADP+)/methenyltetrahydrofolate cyclohydrolase/formyltetrahydrofolate synthetase